MKGRSTIIISEPFDECESVQGGSYFTCAPRGKIFTQFTDLQGNP